MPIPFQLTERLAGFAESGGRGGDTIALSVTELIGPSDALYLAERLDGLEAPVFCRIPGLPRRSQIDHLLVVMNQDLSATAYVNELTGRAEIITARSVTAGSPALAADIADIVSLDFGIPIPEEAGVILFRTHNWNRSLFFDLNPLSNPTARRSFPITQAFAQQALLLLGLASPSSRSNVTPTTRIEHMTNGVGRLKTLLASSCEIEARYQELLHDHPWMLAGGTYQSVDRHTNMDDVNIPDFTAIRCADFFRDIVELKQPFLSLFRADDEFSSHFNDAWNQAERYLDFAHRQRAYLADAKGLRFENPQCILVIGSKLTESQLRRIRAKESLNRFIRVLTYDQLLVTAEHLLRLVQSAGDRVFSIGEP